MQQGDDDSILTFYKKLIAMRKKYPVIAKGKIIFLETGTDKVVAYQRTFGEQQMFVFCNLDRNEQCIKMTGEWSGCRILLENYEDREMPLEGVYTMEPYELLVFGNV